jgi:phosphate acyltransferase
LSARITIALDVMGGDQAPRMVLKGADKSLKRYPQVHFLLFGDEAKITPLLAKMPRLTARAQIQHTSEFITNEAKPSIALRTGRRSSMRLAIDAVADGRADGIVSAGNTGALMAMAKFALKMLPGIDRPAIASFFPTQRGESVMLDLGANIECDADNLVQFALMGDAFARSVLGLTQPTIGLLNVGSEDLKGHDAVRGAATQLRAERSPVKFYGFIGNVALKTAEGTARLFSEFLRAAFKHSVLARIGYLFAADALKKMRERMDPRRYNGAMLLGLNGIAVKSHGGADALGFANAIGVAVDMKANGFVDQIRDELARLKAIQTSPESPQSAAL